MRIDRLEVSGGFLDGLRLSFSSGLTVLIGPRGAGKTSVLELLRFGLGVAAMTEEAESAAAQQARAVLGDGTVSVFCAVQGEPLVFSRTALDEVPTASADFNYVPPLIVSQNEIEAIGLNPGSRREILDSLLDPVARSELLDENDGRARIATVQARLERLRLERTGLLDQGSQVEALAASLAEAEVEQRTSSDLAAKVGPLQKRVADAADELGRLRAATDAYQAAERILAEWNSAVESATLGRPLPDLPSGAAESDIAAAIARAQDNLRAAATEISAAISLASRARRELRDKQPDLQGRLKADADELEKLQKGAGEVGRRVSALRQKLRELESYRERAKQLEAEIMLLAAERDSALDAAEAHAEARYQLRKGRAAAVTQTFSGRIEARVDKSGAFGAYQLALVEALQGSNLQYKSLAGTLAAQMSPRELVEAVENADPDRIARAAGISADRAIRVVAHLQQTSLAELLLAPLDDAVDFALLDGTTYKRTRDLSMGQRCTVVLPLLLAEERETILLDQPEDHLDNAFIVETLVTAMRERAVTGQVIVATHNANIPVLGNAAEVVVLASDGRRGFVRAAAPLDDDDSVEAITTLMEGGREAFARRAAFYTAHDHG